MYRYMQNAPIKDRKRKQTMLSPTDSAEEKTELYIIYKKNAWIC
jgi:hypothetical protein